MAEKSRKPDETAIKDGASPTAEAVSLPAKPETKAEAKAAPAKPRATNRYVWRGPVEGALLTDGKSVVFEGVLAPGKTVALPEGHPRVAVWIARGFAVPEETETKEA